MSRISVPEFLSQIEGVRELVLNQNRKIVLEHLSQLQNKLSSLEQVVQNVSSDSQFQDVLNSCSDLESMFRTLVQSLETQNTSSGVVQSRRSKNISSENISSGEKIGTKTPEQIRNEASWYYVQKLPEVRTSGLTPTEFCKKFPERKLRETGLMLWDQNKITRYGDPK